jgi:hypothetical protein
MANNDYIYPNLAPGIYETSQKVSFEFSPEVDSIISTIDENPVLAKYIAYDNLSPANPFIATVQDGKGNVLFDGGFPKFYNNNYNTSWSVFSDLNASFKYLANAMDFIANPDKVAAGNKNILVIGDANTNNSYCILGTATSDFETSFRGVAAIMGYTLTFKTRGSYSGGYLNPTLEELNDYCGVLFMSSVNTSTAYITDLAITNLLLFRESGNGIFIISDHGNNYTDINTVKNGCSGFFCAANKLIVNFGAYFTGNYDRTSVNVGFLRSTYGDHLLYNNLTDDEYIRAGGSESKINITESTIYNISNFPKISLTDGYSQINILVVLNTGEIINRTYTYGIKVNEIIHFYDKNNLDYISSFKLDSNPFIIDMQIEYNQSLTSDMFGYIQWNDDTIANFTFDKDTKNTTINYYNGYSNTIQIKDGDIIKTSIVTPLTYKRSLFISLPIEITDYRKISILCADIIRDNNILENISFSKFNIFSTSTESIQDNQEKYLLQLAINNKTKSKNYYKYPLLIKDIRDGII